MRAFADVLRFELRLHFTSPLFFGVSLLFFALNLLTLTRTGINLGDNEHIAVNSAWLIFQTEVVLGLFGMLPAIAFAVTAMTRDAERRTTELFFTTPVPRAAFLLGRFSAGALAAIAVGCVGMLGAVVGSFMPWLDPARVAPFDWRPWITCFVVLVLPNLLVFCALFFSVAALTRSTALTFGAALGLVALALVTNLGFAAPVPRWALLADPVGALSIAEAARYWTVSELNSRLPTALLAPNRGLWLGLALAALLSTLWRYRLELAAPRLTRTWRRRNVAASTPKPAPTAHAARTPRFDARATLAQLRSQLRMDWRAVWLSPLFWLALVFTALGVSSAASGLRGADGNVPMLPMTSVMLDFVRINLLQFVLLSIVYFSAVLVFRERDSGIDGISGAAPCPDWIPVASKTLALCGIVTSLLAVSIVVSLAVQELADFHDHELGVFLESTFVYSGFYFWMFCVLAVLVQTLSPGKWSGMVLALLAFVAVIVLPVLHLEHLLYGFRIPPAVHSDMNGFGLFRLQTYTLIAYWSAFCVLLLAAGHLLYPRGYYSSFRERLRDARTRLTAPVLRTCAVAAVAFFGVGAFIFYNTNVLNDYVTYSETEAAQVRYELDHGRYRDAPAPSIVDPDLHVELYAAERRLTSRGTAGLRNAKSYPIGDFVMTVDHRGRIDELAVDGATLVESDPAQGFYLFRPDAPFEPGATLTLRWSLARENRGFPNANPDVEIVANGTYLRFGHMPVPGYCLDCELTERRERFGLPPSRLPALGDPALLDDMRSGVDVSSGFQIVIGTDVDQTAVAPGVLQRTWQENGRSYFEYALDVPARPLVTIQSARFAVARDDWNGVALELYYDPRHAWNARTMLDTMKKGLDYYSREFAPYRFPYFRMAEYARYRTNVQAGVGLVAYSEASGGFATDMRGGTTLEYGTLHELAHMWWGDVYGARMQGRQLLNEGLAQYSTLMVFKQLEAPGFARRIAAGEHDAYLAARGNETVAEQPIVKTEDQGYISYNKAPLALFALQELVGADKVNGALRAYHARFVGKGAPFPTSLDLVAELRAAAGPDYQNLITDLFEKIVLYDVGVTSAEAHPAGGGYDVTVDVTGTQLEAAGNGEEHEVPLDTWFQVAVFAESDRSVEDLEPLYLQYHRLRSGTQRIAVHVTEKPATVAVDPFHLMIDRLRANNLLRLPAQ